MEREGENQGKLEKPVRSGSSVLLQGCLQAVVLALGRVLSTLEKQGEEDPESQTQVAGPSVLGTNKMEPNWAPGGCPREEREGMKPSLPGAHPCTGVWSCLSQALMPKGRHFPLVLVPLRGRKCFCKLSSFYLASWSLQSPAGFPGL